MIRFKRQRITESLTPDAIADALKNLQRKDPLRYREFVEDWKDTIPEAEEHNLPVAPEFKNWIHSTLHDGKNGYETIKALDADVRKAASGIVEEKMITVKAEKRSAKNPEPEKKAKVVESKKQKLTEGETEDIRVSYRIEVTGPDSELVDDNIAEGTKKASLNWGEKKGRKTVMLNIRTGSERIDIDMNYEDLKRAMESFDKNFNQ
jgi:hypothetical protein